MDEEQRIWKIADLIGYYRYRLLYPQYGEKLPMPVEVARQINALFTQGELLRKASLTLLIAEIQGCQPNPEITVILESWIKANDLHPEEVKSYDSIKELREALKEATDGK